MLLLSAVIALGEYSLLAHSFERRPQFMFIFHGPDSDGVFFAACVLLVLNSPMTSGSRLTCAVQIEGAVHAVPSLEA